MTWNWRPLNQFYKPSTYKVPMYHNAFPQIRPRLTFNIVRLNYTHHKLSHATQTVATEILKIQQTQ